MHSALCNEINLNIAAEGNLLPRMEAQVSHMLKFFASDVQVEPINWEKEFEDFDQDVIAKCKNAIEGKNIFHKNLLVVKQSRAKTTLQHS